MSNKKTIKKKQTVQRKPPRKCSVCGKTGHNARTCVTGERGTGNGGWGNAKGSKKIKRSKSSGFVMVHVRDEAIKSPHVVELNKTQDGKHWDGVRVYSQAPQVKQERGVVDFAKMVRDVASTQARQHDSTTTTYG